MHIACHFRRTLKAARLLLYIASVEGSRMTRRVIDDLATSRSTAWLGKAGLRPTRQRLMLAALLVGDGQNRHVTAESLYALAARTGEGVSLATVYNTLRAFCDAGLMNEVVVDGSKSYFDTRIDDHPHYYWEDTGALTDAPAEDLRLAQLPPPPEGTEIARVDVVIRLRRL
jgi:Fur family iron response transcriptional regulator